MSRSIELHATPRTVLVADDDDDMRGLMAATLKRDGYRVVEAKDGGELLELLRDASDEIGERFDIVVTDVRMPRLSGLGVLQELKRARMHLPVIVVTVFGDDSMHIVARRLGAVGVLRKPFDIDDFRTAVMNASQVLAQKDAAIAQ
ncbi:MAG: response regulator [Polyangiaceae bacterium]